MSSYAIRAFKHYFQMGHPNWSWDNDSEVEAAVKQLDQSAEVADLEKRVEQLEAVVARLEDAIEQAERLHITGGWGDECIRL